MAQIAARTARVMPGVHLHPADCAQGWDESLRGNKQQILGDNVAIYTKTNEAVDDPSDIVCVQCREDQVSRLGGLKG